MILQFKYVVIIPTLNVSASVPRVVVILGSSST